MSIYLITPDNLHEGNIDYTAHLTPAYSGVWLTVEPYSIYIKRTEDGLIIDTYPRKKEMELSLATIDLMDADIPKEEPEIDWID